MLYPLYSIKVIQHPYKSKLHKADIIVFNTQNHYKNFLIGYITILKLC